MMGVQQATAGVGEAPRHEIAGSWAPSVQRALWRFDHGAGRCGIGTLRTLGKDCRLPKARAILRSPPLLAASVSFLSDLACSEPLHASAVVAGR